MNFLRKIRQDLLILFAVALVLNCLGLGKDRSTVNKVETMHHSFAATINPLTIHGEARWCADGAVDGSVDGVPVHYAAGEMHWFDSKEAIVTITGGKGLHCRFQEADGGVSMNAWGILHFGAPDADNPHCVVLHTSGWVDVNPNGAVCVSPDSHQKRVIASGIPKITADGCTWLDAWDCGEVIAKSGSDVNAYNCNHLTCELGATATAYSQLAVTIIAVLKGLALFGSAFLGWFLYGVFRG